MAAPLDTAAARPRDTASPEGDMLEGDLPSSWRGWDRWIGLAIVAACCAFVFFKLHPELLLRNTTTNGGDTGAHVWWPAYLRDHLLPHFRIVGWSPDWYSGFPVGQFYFPLPALMVVILNIVLPYTIAFKIVTALGAIALPFAAYVFGWGIRAPRPTPVAFSLAAVVFLFFTGNGGSDQVAQTISFNQHIMGGTLASNLAGEFSFTIALAFALCFLGLLSRALDERKYLGWSALLLAATVLSHIVVALFAIVGAVVIAACFLISRTKRPLDVATGIGLLAAIGGVVVLLDPPGGVLELAAVVAITAAGVMVVVQLITDRAQTLGPGLAVGVIGGLLTAVWSLPLVVRFEYTTAMRYEKLTQYADYLFPSYLIVSFLLAAVGAFVGIVLLRRSTLVLTLLTGVWAVWFVQWPEGRAWNLRFLPFWYLGVFLLAAVGVAELLRAPMAFVDWVHSGRSLGGPRVRAEGLLAGPAIPAEGPPQDAPPDEPPQAPGRQWTAEGIRHVTAIATTAVMVVIAVVGLVIVQDGNSGHSGGKNDFLNYWGTWNYEGYEGKPAYPEYKNVIDTMNALPAGGAVWEKATNGTSDTLNAYGSDFALMILPYWTDGKIGSSEGLYYDSAATTPYHFLMVAHLAKNPPNTVRGLTYAATLSNFNLGIQQARMLGLRYYMAQSTEAKQLADTDPDLKLVAEVADLDGALPSGWKIYEIKNAALVAPLAYQPVVVDGHPGGEDWQRLAAAWWENPSALDRPLAASGPSEWQHASAAKASSLPKKALPEVKVTHVKRDDMSLSFDVSRTGVPVLVRTSYYPNWNVSGAHGPWRVTPNMMVVVPTSKHVSMHYGFTTVDYAGYFGTVLAFIGVVGLFWLGRRRRPDSDAPETVSASPDRPGATSATPKEEGTTMTVPPSGR